MTLKVTDHMRAYLQASIKQPFGNKKERAKLAGVASGTIWSWHEKDEFNDWFNREMFRSAESEAGFLIVNILKKANSEDATTADRKLALDVCKELDWGGLGKRITAQGKVDININLTPRDERAVEATVRETKLIDG